MLENLHVKNLALIEEADIAFGEGFHVLTGETGAGKSIVIGSVNLALGAKASPDMIRSGEESALIELTFCLTEKECARIRDLGYDPDEDGRLLLSRKISTGRSVCRINGETVSASQLKEIAPLLLNIYGQHENQNLLKKSSYLSMIDSYVGKKAEEALSVIRSENAHLKELLKERASLQDDDDLREREAELLRFEIREIEEASLTEGEDEELEKRFRFLSNIRKIEEGVNEVHALTGYDGEYGAGSAIGHALSRLRTIASLSEEAEALAEELAGAEDLLNGFNRSLSAYAESLTFDGEEFAAVEERLNVLNRMKDKYGPTLGDVLSALEDKRNALEKLSGYTEYVTKIDNEINDAGKKVLDRCGVLSSLRKEAAGRLSEELTGQLKDLNFSDVRLEIRVTPDEEHFTDLGYDEASIFISLNTGEEMRELQNVASGGELSRIMLALKSVFARKEDVSTLIFDEIDAGISGVTAYRVSEMLGKLSGSHQIICITHLPQIAAMADSHSLIEKGVESGRTHTLIRPLDREGQIREIARLLGADTITEASLTNARELKEKAKDKKK